MSKPHCSVREFVETNLHHVQARLRQSDLMALARQCGFLQREPRKAPVFNLACAFVAVAAETVVSLERVAAVIALSIQGTYRKQSVHERLGPALERFLGHLATTLLEPLTSPVKAPGWFASFTRVLLGDSTVEPLPDQLADVFAGPGNGRPRRYAAMKVQLVCDLLHSQVLQVSLSGFRRNDQAAAPDILSVLQPGDLVLRDLGYFALPVFAKIQRRGAFFLSRYKHGVLCLDPVTGGRLDLAKLLRAHGALDREVLLGAEKVPARLVAQPVSEALANERRRQAQANRDRRLNPSPARLYLLGWNLLVTNVTRTVWPAKAFQPIYRLRWRVEMIFKAWKSHLGLRELNCRTADLLRLSVLSKLLFCMVVYSLCDALELLGDHCRHVSLLRLARILGQCACWFAATVLGVSLEQWLDCHFSHHAFYEKRKDRRNFYELFDEVCLP